MELIDSYMYIMNVRYSNEIHLEKQIHDSLLNIRFPGMVLQPVIENALHHGLGGVEWEKHIWFRAFREQGEAVISVRDNGIGIGEDMLRELNHGSGQTGTKDEKDWGNGVGLVNVRERLRLYFDRENVLTVESGGEGKGTTVVIRVPILQR